MACAPTCTIPITGTKVPQYHAKPTSKKGYRRRHAQAAAETVPKTAPAANTQPTGHWPGWG